MSIVIEGLMIWKSKCHQNNSLVVCDGYVKYEEAEIDRLVAILKTNNWGGGAVEAEAPVKYNKQPASARAA